MEYTTEVGPIQIFSRAERNSTQLKCSPVTRTTTRNSTKYIFNDHQTGVWRPYGWCLKGLYWVSGGCLERVWWVSRGCLGVFWDRDRAKLAEWHRKVTETGWQKHKEREIRTERQKEREGEWEIWRERDREREIERETEKERWGERKRERGRKKGRGTKIDKKADTDRDTENRDILRDWYTDKGRHIDIFWWGDQIINHNLVAGGDSRVSWRYVVNRG